MNLFYAKSILNEVIINSKQPKKDEPESVLTKSGELIINKPIKNNIDKYIKGKNINISKEN